MFPGAVQLFDKTQAALVVFNRKASAYEGYKYVNLINGSDIQRGEENYFIDRWINVKANNTYTLVIPCNYYDDKANDCYESLDGLIINCSARNENTSSSVKLSFILSLSYLIFKTHFLL